MRPRAGAVVVLALAYAGWLTAAWSLLPAPPDDLRLIVERFMARERIAGAVVAYGRAGTAPQLLALGHAAPGGGEPMRADLRFRIASLSKPVTAAAVLSLVDRGRLGLDEPLVSVLPEVATATDERYAAITVRDLLRHAGGWDRAESFDPVFDPASLYGEGEGRHRPARCDGIARDMLTRPLQFAPGARQAYSNLGYCWLGMVVAARSGRDYGSYVRREILAPLGLSGFRLGESGVPPDGLARHHARRGGGHVALPRDAASDAALKRLGPAGGWVATAEDYFRFASRDLPEETVDRPVFGREVEDYYGLGWRVWPGKGGATLTHAGFMPGVFSLAMRRPDGLVIVALFNGGVRDGLAAFERLFGGIRGLPLPVTAPTRAGHTPETFNPAPSRAHARPASRRAG